MKNTFISFYKLFMDDDLNHPVAEVINKTPQWMLLDRQQNNMWEPVEFILRVGVITDYQAIVYGWDLCSERLKNTIDQNASPSDAYEWLENIVIDPHGVRHTYYALHIPDRPDVLDEEWTDYGRNADGTIDKSCIVAPMLQRSKLGDRRVIRPRGCGTTFLADPIVKAIRKAKCTGMKFKKTTVRET